MAFIVIGSGEVDAESPLADQLFTEIKTDLDYLKSCLTDGNSSPQVLSSSQLTLAASGTALTVNNNATFGVNLSISGTLTTAVFFSSEQLLELMGW